jgi:hypothetical protein
MKTTEIFKESGKTMQEIFEEFIVMYFNDYVEI